ADKRSPGEKDELFAWWLPTQDQAYQALLAKVQPLEQEEAAIRSRGTVTHVMQERPEMATAHILYRGEYDKRRDAVKPGTPRALPRWPADLPKDRLGFAQWLL